MRIFFYILSQFLKFTAGVLAVALFMFVLSDLVDKHSRFFVRFDATSLDIFKYYIYEIPFQLVQVLPFCALVGSIATMIILNRNGEIIPIRAAGVGPLRLARPILAGGLLLTLLTVFISHVLAPQFSIQKNLLIDQLKGEGEASLTNSRWKKSGSWIYAFGNYNIGQRALESLTAFELTFDDLEMKSIWTADKAVYDAKTKLWMVTGRTEVELDGGRVRSFEGGRAEMMELPYEPQKLFKDEREAIELSFTELSRRLEEAKQGGVAFRRLEVSLHVKAAYCVAALLLSLLGVKFAYLFERSTAMMKYLLWSLVFGVGYYFVLSSTRAVALSSDLPTAVAGWGANLFLVMILFAEFRKMLKN